MKPNTIKRDTSWNAGNVRKGSMKAEKRSSYKRSAPSKRTILLISQDTRLHDSLRLLANTVGMLVVRLDAMQGVVPTLCAIPPAIVLLDLDLPNQAAWEIADTLLQEQNCPPVVLLSSFSERFDVNTALRAGSIVDKSQGSARLLELAHEAASTPPPNLVERNAILRVLIRWLKPCRWSLPTTPAHHFWGINE
jgi:CheY-like chemotaxis protein